MFKNIKKGQQDNPYSNPFFHIEPPFILTPKQPHSDTSITLSQKLKKKRHPSYADFIPLKSVIITSIIFFFKDI